MTWRQLIVRAPASRVGAVEALLQLAGAEALALADAADAPLLEPGPGETPLWPEVLVRALFAGDVDAATIEALLASALPSGARVRLEALDEHAWRDAVHRAVPARRFGRGLWLVQADAEQPIGADALVRLHMGLAFGTGEHATTALCLEWLAAQGAADADVLDYGCGSGVLALAAIALGAQRAWAVDNDPQALAAAASNARLNAADEKLWVGLPEDLPQALEVDLAVANILAAPLLEHEPLFARRVRAGGRIVLSGVLESQCEALLDAYRADFEDLDSAAKEGWVRITGRRRRS